MKDNFGRKIDYLRLALTDSCNLNCLYCRKQQQSEVSQLPAEEILRFVAVAVAGGVTKVKLTGGEPLLRSDLEAILQGIRQFKQIKSLTLTTNGVYLKQNLKILKKYGVNPINISLDTPDKQLYKAVTGYDCSSAVLEAVREAVAMGFKVKINTVLLEGVNQNPLPVAALAEELPVSVRFIELMPLGCGKGFKGVSNSRTMEALQAKYGSLTKQACKGNGPCVYYSANGLKGSFGFISPISDCFCGDCNRLRLTAEGYVKPCLYCESSLNIKGKVKEEMEAVFTAAVKAKPSEHSFAVDNNCIEQRSMYGIGG